MGIRQDIQRKNIHHYLRTKVHKLDIGTLFNKKQQIVIYGCGDLGKYLCDDIFEIYDILCFIDNASKAEMYHNIPIYSSFSLDLREVLINSEHLIVIVTPVWDFSNIYNYLMSISDKNEILPVNLLFTALEMGIDFSKYRFGSIYDEALRTMLHSHVTIKEIMCASSAYMFLQYLLLKDDWENTYFFLSDVFPNKLYHRMQAIGINCCKTASYDKEEKARLFDCIRLLALYASVRRLEVYAPDGMPEDVYFSRDKFTVLEDGTTNYLPKYVNRFRFMLPVLGDWQNATVYGYNQYAKKIILTGRLSIPEVIKDKVEVKNLKSLWYAKNEGVKEKILELFDVPIEDIRKYVKDGFDYILLTQPMKTFVYSFTNDEQLTMYKKILNKYDCSRVLIKPHPRDDFDYKNAFPECEVIRSDFPFEFFYFLDVPLEKIITIQSSAAMGLYPKEKVDMQFEYIKMFDEDLYDELTDIYNRS
ncbi:glycosyltransferase family 52 [Selenomonas sp. AB3002]|uniref:glycosyltransferase family 52 n=1 Tax=Selenomonas sp. AB3002 TaxID=1392502 RepID=UPI00068CB23F